jgi:predicted transposase YbfD/YdcC
MNNYTLDQKTVIDSIAAVNTATKLQRKSHTSIAEESILERLMDFAYSIPDFRRTDKGNHRHKLGDIILLIIFARMSKCIGRADMIEFGKHNLRKFQSMNMLKNGVPSEPTLCRVENGIDSMGLAKQMTEFSNLFYNELVKNCDHPEIISIDGKAMRGTIQENGRNPDIVSAYASTPGITLATEACKEKSNEIKAVPLLLDKIDITGKLVTADAMSMQKEIIDKIREKGGYFLIELKANQRALRYGVEDRIKQCISKFSYQESAKLEHGRIETRTYNVYDGLELIADKDKWGGNLTVVEFISNCTKKSTNETTTETRLYVSNLPDDTPWIGMAVRKHWAIESMHWGLDFNLLQDSIKRKTTNAARNLDTLQRIVYSLFSIWKGRRKKRSDKAKGLAKLMRHVSRSFTNLLHFLSQK